MKVICITGTPGTGKTTLAKKLSQKQRYPVLDVKRFIKEKDLSSGYDKEKRCEIIDTKKLVNAIKKEIKLVKKEHSPKGIIIDSHLSHYLPSKLVNLCIVTKCDLKELEKRLKKRRYAKSKIRENLDAEIFDICMIEAQENKHYIYVINTTKNININQLLQKTGEKI